MIGIVVAVREEAAAIRRRMSSVEAYSTGGFLFWRGRLGGCPVVLAKSGMGAERARRAVSVLLEGGAWDPLIIAGFAASLAEGAVPGDLVLAERVEDGTGPEDGAVFMPEAGLQRLARKAVVPGVRLHVGGLRTVAALASIAAAKRTLAARAPGVLAADMETAGAVEAAQAAGVPWIAVRAITDGPDDDLPFDFSRCLDPATGETNRRRVILATLARPRKLPALARLGARSARAAGNLAAFVEQFARVVSDHEGAQKSAGPEQNDPVG